MKKNTATATSTGVVLSLVLSAMILFTGCGAPENLEEYIANDEAAAESFESLKSSTSVSGMSIDIEDNSIVYTYKYSYTYDSAALEQMKVALADTMDNSASLFTGVADTFEKESGIDGITVKVIYINGDGTEIYSKEY